ncbi:hypothetical protein C7S16_4851 [Burkholderia thailandensis]|uniref:Uncharacterized protein n=1 Tax=Burkholderia thailandensis TaxID=57975 RepID=A0AAW9CQB5_BURTH|nr:hypothetical protein [Burkholderia thailandensis]MDW9252372.1 hypothetical protein [Burkholderia thailandensis]
MRRHEARRTTNDERRVRIGRASAYRGPSARGTWIGSLRTRIAAIVRRVERNRLESHGVMCGMRGRLFPSMRVG